MLPIFRKLQDKEESSRVPGMMTEVGDGLGYAVPCFYGGKDLTVLKL